MINNYNKNILNKISIFTIILVLSIISISIITAQDAWPSTNVCCEKTINGAWCQNTLAESCDNSKDPVSGAPFRESPTSCDATSFCKLGCCIDSEEGLCMENSPQKVCQSSVGTWVDNPTCNVPQCNLGCCIIGDQASFVTLTRCKRLSNIYGLTTNFKNDIKKESDCVMLAYKQDKGACVYDSDGQKTCKFTTRAECLNSETSKQSTNITSNAEFYKDYLCSADELGTLCGPTTDTICIDGKDEVYFKDSCGNPANIYDANKIYSKDPSYWRKIVPKSDVCGFNNKEGNINSKSCGNCNYLQGSICGKGTATYGELTCKDLNCYKTENGNNYKNGESWCTYMSESGEGKDLPGSRYFRHVCIQGEETIEPCADFRNEVCYSSNVNTGYGNFVEAACRVNRWSDCIDQPTEEKCLNMDKRDCYWVNGSHYENAGKNIGKTSGSVNGSFTGSAGTSASTTAVTAPTTDSTGKGILNGGGICLPNYPPGLKFYQEGDASSVCSQGNSIQFVNYSTSFFGSKTCKGNCEVLEDSWVKKMNNVCTSLGDCGAKTNFIGKFTDDGYAYKVNGNLSTIQQGILEATK